jgi:hypothetical protein
MEGKETNNNAVPNQDAPAAPVERSLGNTPLGELLKLQYSADSDEEEMMHAYRESLKENDEKQKKMEQNEGKNNSVDKENNSNKVLSTPSTTAASLPSSFYHPFQPLGSSPMVSNVDVSSHVTPTPPTFSVYPWGGGTYHLGPPPITQPRGGRCSAPPATLDSFTNRDLFKQGSFDVVKLQPKKPVLPTRPKVSAPPVPPPVPPRASTAPIRPARISVGAQPGTRTVARKKPPATVAAQPRDDESVGAEEEDDLNQSTKFRAAEIDTLMCIVKDILPIGKIEWERVTAKYNEKYPQRPRGMRNLRNRFQAYANKKPPTGDPNCPPLVRRAKQITEFIKQKAGLAVMNSNSTGIEGPVVANKRNASEIVGVPATTKKSRATSATDKYLEAMLASEKIQAKKDAKEERMRHEERQETMRLFMGTMSAFAAAISGKSVEVPTSTLPATLPVQSVDSNTDALSSSDSSGSGYSSSSGSEVEWTAKDAIAASSNSAKKWKYRFNERLERRRRQKKKLRKEKMKGLSPKGSPKKKDRDSDGSTGDRNPKRGAI